MDITNQLRERACPAGEPWTGDNPEQDHGHTDCWLFHQAAVEIEVLRKQLDASQKISRSYRIRLANFANNETKCNINLK
jgi:hypothetical protein